MSEKETDIPIAQPGLQSMTHTDNDGAQIQITLQIIGKIISGSLPPETIPDTQWKDLFMLADRHEALPILMGQLRSYFIGHDNPAIRQFAVLSLKPQSVFRPILQTASNLNELLRTNNKHVIWLKGVALGFEYYPHAWMRKMADIDIWAEKTSIQNVLGLLIDSGYSLDSTFGGNRLQSDQFANHYTLQSPEEVQVELHFDLIQPRVQMLTPEQNSWFWEHTEEIESEIGILRVLQPEANFLHLAYHDIIMHDMLDISAFNEANISIKRKYDLYLLVTQSNLDWELIWSQANKLGWTFAVQKALSQIAYYFGWEPPYIVEEWYDISPVEPFGVAAYTENEKKIIAKWQTFLQLPFRVKLRYLQTMLFPTRQKLHWAYPELDQQSYFKALLFHYKCGFEALWKYTIGKS